MIISFLRMVRFAGQHFWRNIWLSLITMSMLVLALLTINVLFMLSQVAQAAIASVEKKIDISVYFQSDISETKVQSAVAFLRGLEQVQDIEIITSDEALEQFKTRHRQDQVILSSLEEINKNPFGPTLVIKARSVEDFPFILEALNHPQFSQDIREKDFSDYTQMIGRIKTTTDRIRWVGIGLSILFLFVAIFIIFNTVRLNIYLYREEIGIMKLVGASNGFVRGPFFLEIFYETFIATGLTIFLTFGFLRLCESRLDIYFLGVQTGLFTYFSTNGIFLFSAEFFSILLIGFLSTSFAMRKYLRI
jgi:cell division transport system permease protein